MYEKDIPITLLAEIDNIVSGRLESESEKLYTKTAIKEEAKQRKRQVKTGFAHLKR